MAKGTILELFENWLGPLGKIDRTIGKEGGFSLSLGGATSDGSLKLSSKKKGTSGGSPARHERANVYCNCDDNYKAMPIGKKKLLVPWYRKVLDKTYLKTDRYHIWMKICLGGRIEASAFYCYCHLQRYRIFNDTAETWRDQLVDLSGIENSGPDNSNFRLFLLYVSKTERNGDIYEAGMIDRELSFELIEQGVIRYTSPFCDKGAYYFVDVYSLKRC